MVVLKVIGEAFCIPIFAKRAISFRGKRQAPSAPIILHSDLHTNLYRDRLFSIYRDKRPNTLRRRILNLQRQRQAYHSPSPNHIWHIDSYIKLSLYGIEIYTTIDGYSRYIL
jgi:hypothetical protein